jgi:hypothetical protein
LWRNLSLLAVLVLISAAPLPAAEALREPPRCLGQVTSLKAWHRDLFIGTQAGLQVLVPDKGGLKLRPVKGLPLVPVKALRTDGEALVADLADLSSIRLASWRRGENSFAVSTIAAPAPESGPFTTQCGWLVTGRVDWRGKAMVATMGGGLFQDDAQVLGLPSNLTAIEPLDGRLYLASLDGLILLEPNGNSRAVHMNPCPDCRITSLASWHGGLYGGTMSGGLVRLPEHQTVPGPPGALASRVNGLWAGKEVLWVGTEAGMASFNGVSLTARPDITRLSVTGICGDARRLVFNTTRGLHGYSFAMRRTQRLSANKGFFVQSWGLEVAWGGMYGAWAMDGKGRVRRLLTDYVTGFVENDGRLFAATYFNGVWEIFRSGEPSKLCEGGFLAVAAREKLLLLGGSGGSVLTLDPDTCVLAGLPGQPSSLGVINALLPQPGTLWAASPTGVLALK